jgi:hypothetical protein
MNYNNIAVKLRINKEFYIGIFYKHFYNSYFTYYLLRRVTILKITANINNKIKTHKNIILNIMMATS